MVTSARRVVENRSHELTRRAAIPHTRALDTTTLRRTNDANEQNEPLPAAVCIDCDGAGARTGARAEAGHRNLLQLLPRRRGAPRPGSRDGDPLFQRRGAGPAGAAADAGDAG